MPGWAADGGGIQSQKLAGLKSRRKLICPVNGHPGWADAVRGTIFGLMPAEEMGITQANIEAKEAEAKANPNRADLHRFLGVEGEFGQQLGLPSDFVVKAVKGVGHY